MNSRRRSVDPYLLLDELVWSPSFIDRPDPTARMPPNRLLRLFEIRDDELVRCESMCGPASFALRVGCSTQSGWTERPVSGIRMRLFTPQDANQVNVFRADSDLDIRHIYVAATWEGNVVVAKSI